MIRLKKFKSLERKWGFLIALGVLALLGLVFWVSRPSGSADYDSLAGGMQVTKVEQGALASSTLLTGTVKVAEEEKIYFDASRGSSIATYYVAVGDYVYQGQPLFQYVSSTAQANYDQAVRNLNKVARQIEELKATGAATTIDETTGNSYVTDAARLTYNNQLQDLNDAYADAQITVNKANLELAQTLEISAVTGRVVDINPDINQASQGGHLIMHVVSEGKLQVEGSLNEYDLGTVSVGQKVKLTSKVYPEKTWEGRIAYVSNYPSENAGQTTTGASSAAYPFRIEFTSTDVSALKQGFKLSIEVETASQEKLVPLTAIVSEGDQDFVWVYNRQAGTVSKQEVTLGRADAINQEVKAGLSVNQDIILYPSADLTDGQKIDANQLLDLTEMED